MTFMTGLQCHLCGAKFPAEALWVCEQCLGPLEVVYDYDGVREAMTRDVDREPRRETSGAIRELLPITGEPRTGFHSGFTPLVRADRLAARARRARAVHQGRLGQPSDAVVQGSRRLGGGDARRRARASPCSPARRPATSPTASPAHAARLGLECCVFIPDNLEPGKVLGSAIFRPHDPRRRGNYDDVNRLCTQVADRYGWGFANINLRSYYAEGAKTLGFEIAEQLGWRFPQHSSRRSPAARCCRASARGFRELRQIGLVDGELPRDPRGAGGRLRAGRPRARGGARVPGSGQAEHDRQVDRDRQSRRRLPGAARRCKSTGGAGAMVDRRGDPRRRSSCWPRPKASSPSRPAARRWPARSS